MARAHYTSDITRYFDSYRTVENKNLEPDIASIAGIIGESSRAKMLTALMCGKALTATELAIEANITAQTASSHLSKLVESQLLIVRKQGRHRYFQLKNTNIADLIESLLNIAADAQHQNIQTGPLDSNLRKARVCYDHLAGEVGVLLFNSLLSHGIIEENDNDVILSETGISYFQNLGVDFEIFKKTKRPLCKSCLDWSERRSHLSGSLGQWILEDLLHKGWASQDLDSRVIRFTKSGLTKFYNTYGIPVTMRM